MDKKLKIVASPFLFFGGIFISISAIVVISFYLYAAIVIQYNVGAIIFSSIFGFILIVACISLYKVWFATLEFSSEGILLKAPMRKNVFRNYKQYSHMSYASYWHGSPAGIGSTKWYIVISTFKLNQYDLTHINGVHISDNIIKIQYSEKRRKQLQEVLPEKLAFQLKNPPKK